MLRCQKDEFYLSEGLHYLNCAYLSPLSRAVENAGIAGIRSKRIPSEIRPEDFFEDSNRVRELFGRIVGAKPSSVAIIPSVSYGIASIARNVPIERGENIIVLEEQFPSNVYAWRRLAADRGAEIRTVGPDGSDGGGSGRAARWNERILATIDARTAVVAMPHVHWTDGTLFDLEAISDRVRDVGGALVVDGTQSVGALEFDIERIRPDALVCAGYKWLFGPYAIGLAYFDERHHSGVPLEENWITRLHSEKFDRLIDYEDRYQPGATRFDMGERSNFVLMPMMAAALGQVDTWGAENIQAYCSALTKHLVNEARELGFVIEDTDGRAHHLFGIRTSDGVDPNVLRTELERRNVSVSVRGSAVRVAPHVYNDEQDVAALLDALRASARIAS